MWCLVEAIMNVLFDDAGFADRLVAKEDDFDFDFSCESADGMIHKWVFLKIK